VEITHHAGPGRNYRIGRGTGGIDRIEHFRSPVARSLSLSR
jgi:hypothetical protein